MNIQNKFFQIFQDDNNNLSVVSFDDDITLKISTLLKYDIIIFRDHALAVIDERLQACGLGSLAIINQNKDNTKKNKDNWNVNGIDAEILEPNAKAWKKGKIRMRVVLEFCPEESNEEQPEIASNNSPLDDIRQTMNK